MRPQMTHAHKVTERYCRYSMRIMPKTCTFVQGYRDPLADIYHMLTREVSSRTMRLSMHVRAHYNQYHLSALSWCCDADPTGDVSCCGGVLLRRLVQLQLQSPLVWGAMLDTWGSIN